MTKTEQAELKELGTTAEALSAKTAQMEALVNGESKPDRELKASIALVGSTPNSYLDALQRASTGGQDAAIEDTRKRKRRSDAGKPRQKPSAIAQQPPTALAGLVQRLKTLYETKISRIAELETINDQIQDLSERHAVVANEVDAISEDIEAVYAEMLKGE